MANMSTEETFKFLELYQAENCLWNPKNKYHKNKNVINDSWKRIADTMGIPVHELKKKKDNLLSTFRTNLKKRNASIRSGAGTEDVYQPIWIFYDVMAAFLTDVYESTSILNTEEKTQPDLYEEGSASNVQVSDNIPDAKNEDHNDANIPTTSQNKPIIQSQKRRAKDPPEMQEANKKMSTAFTALNKALANKENIKEEDECDLFCKMLAKQIREYPKLEREEIMYELHGVMMNRRRRYNTMQGRSYAVSSPSQIILSRPSTSNSMYPSTPSPIYVVDSPHSVQSPPQNMANQQTEMVNIISQEVLVPQTSKMYYESCLNMTDDNNTDHP
ncbi:unnamed protein product [Spodoptera exigua]|uniref:MADF domain-containing protein n=1 Tax=Spodoptera exigua TaxID=7107 RepID=A0A835GMG1_SPOEX|nr:hypothetical protein HW555_004042 [Spodoptera exigua]CAH0697409.1 unnamed protein product [Spodoptera exigua]